MKPNIFFGIYQLVISPSGLFSLITLIVITYASLKLHNIAALAGFATIIPAILAHTENRETMQTNNVNQLNK
jgi:c-di-AMP phosphodiesterase-like protein